MMRHGLIPDGWSRISLGMVADIQTGISKSASRQNKDPIWIPYLRVANVQNGFVDLSDVQTMPIDKSMVDRFRLRNNDLLLVEGNGNPANLGRCAIWDGCLGVCVHQNHIFAVRTKCTSIDYRFLALQIQSARGRHYLLACSKSSSGLATLNSAQLKELPLLVPGVAEQRAIVIVLSTWDRGVEQFERLIAAKERRKRALAQQLLTGKQRLSGFVESAGVQSTHVGLRPSDWKIFRIADLAAESGIRNGESDDIPVLSCTKHQGLVSSLEYFGKRVFSTDTSNYKVVRRGEFAYATNHIEEGSIGLLDFLDQGLVSPMYTVFCVDKTVEARFLYALFKTETYRRIFAAYTNGSVNRRGGLRWNDFKLIQVALPPLDEQRQIASTLDTMNEELELLRTAVILLKRQKSALMQKLLAGEIRVGTRKGPITNEA